MNPNVRTAWLSFIVGFALIAIVLFASAGSLKVWQIWAYLIVTAFTSGLLTLSMVSDPELTTNRLKAGPSAEQRPLQKVVVTFGVFAIIAAYVLGGLDLRFGWSNMPVAFSIAGDIAILFGMWMVHLVFRANSYGSSTVQVVQGQKVISTGPYAIVRNPMYSSAAVYLIGLAFALGSYWMLIPCLLAILSLVVRLFDEERFLIVSLQGYAEYCEKVRWHLIPYIF